MAGLQAREGPMPDSSSYAGTSRFKFTGLGLAISAIPATWPGRTPERGGVYAQTPGAGYSSSISLSVRKLGATRHRYHPDRRTGHPRRPAVAARRLEALPDVGYR